MRSFAVRVSTADAIAAALGKERLEQVNESGCSWQDSVKAQRVLSASQLTNT